MLYIGELTEEEVSYFCELQDLYPDKVMIRTEHGFDMSSTIQVVIDISDILETAVPAIISAVELILMYRIQKRQNELTEKEIELHKREIHINQNNGLKSEFELRASSDGETNIIIKTSDLDALVKEPGKLKSFLKKVNEELRSLNE